MIEERGNNMSKDGNKKLAIGAAIGVVTGFVAGILTAPQSGKETRKDIKDTATKVTREAERKLKAVYTELSDMIDKAKALAKKEGAKVKQELLTALQSAEGTQQKVKEVITAVRNGEADNPELDKAVKEANTAKEHLRKFLAKD
jgi:gas vesicle protein